MPSQKRDSINQALMKGLANRQNKMPQLKAGRLVDRSVQIKRNKRSGSFLDRRGAK